MLLSWAQFTALLCFGLWPWIISWAPGIGWPGLLGYSVGYSAPLDQKWKDGCALSPYSGPRNRLRDIIHLPLLIPQILLQVYLCFLPPPFWISHKILGWFHLFSNVSRWIYSSHCVSPSWGSAGAFLFPYLPYSYLSFTSILASISYSFLGLSQASEQVSGRVHTNNLP